MAQITERESRQIEDANASGRTPTVFIHGLWLLPSSWDRWRTMFEEAGYTTIAPGWPDDPNTVEEANRLYFTDFRDKRSAIIEELSAGRSVSRRVMAAPDVPAARPPWFPARIAL